MDVIKLKCTNIYIKHNYMYTKECPVCKALMSYNDTKSYERSLSDNCKCTKCRAKRYDSYPLERDCINCGKKIKYSSASGCRDAIKRNGRCSTCSKHKWHEEKFGIHNIFEFESKCKVCSKIKKHTLKKAITSFRMNTLISKCNERMCRSCAMKLRDVSWDKIKDTKPELLFESYLQKWHIPYIKQYRLNKKHYDFCIPEHKILIEIDGIYWHGKNVNEVDLNETQLHNKKNDLEKESIAKNHNYELVRIWEDEINDDSINKILCLIKK